MAGEVAARVYRGEGIEAEHCAVIAVVNADGKLTHYYGDPETVYMTRSSVKPFQALPLILSGGLDRFGFSPRQLAIMCASHNGNDEHREVVQSNLDQAGTSADDLLCGTHLPIFMRLKGLYPDNGEDKDVLRHNCSGKHSGFLALSKHLGAPLAEYLEPAGDPQQRIKQSVADRCEYPVEKIGVGIDGCSAPVFSMPMKNLAIGFKNLALGKADDAHVRAALDRVRSAMMEFPYLVAGEGRFDYDFMRSFPGNGVAKVGAESIQGMGFVQQGIGICVKVQDGGARALGPICVEVLKQLGLIGRIEDFPHLAPYGDPEIRNYRRIVTGRIEVDFDLRKA